MHYNGLDITQNGIISIQSSNGEVINVDGTDLSNNEIVQDLINTRLDIIQPQIETINDNIGEVVNLSPSEEAEINYLKIRISNLEQENGHLLNIVSKLKTSHNVNHNDNTKASRLEVLKIEFKVFVGASEFETLWEKIKQKINNTQSIFNKFAQIYSRIGKLNSDKITGQISPEQENITFNELTFSLLSLIDTIKVEDLAEHNVVQIKII